MREAGGGVSPPAWNGWWPGCLEGPMSLGKLSFKRAYLWAVRAEIRPLDLSLYCRRKKLHGCRSAVMQKLPTSSVVVFF